MMEASKGTSPFAPFEWMIALRYLRLERIELSLNLP